MLHQARCGEFRSSCRCRRSVFRYKALSIAAEQGEHVLRTGMEGWRRTRQTLPVMITTRNPRRSDHGRRGSDMPPRLDNARPTAFQRAARSAATRCWCYLIGEVRSHHPPEWLRATDILDVVRSLDNRSAAVHENPAAPEQRTMSRVSSKALVRVGEAAIYSPRRGGKFTSESVSRDVGDCRLRHVTTACGIGGRHPPRSRPGGSSLRSFFL